MQQNVSVNHTTMYLVRYNHFLHKATRIIKLAFSLLVHLCTNITTLFISFYQFLNFLKLQLDVTVTTCYICYICYAERRQKRKMNHKIKLSLQ